jgi:hypothetical protein
MVGGSEADETFRPVVRPGVWLRQDGASPLLLDQADVIIGRLPTQVFLG